jgi:signal transduction histidine kinase
VPREALGSANWTRQILRNLLSNAEKYSPPEQPIEVDIEIDAPSLLTVHVLDRGIGIPEETAVLFEPFWRDGDARRVAGGMGIGLAVSRWLAHAQGGDIWAQPRVGGGSDFAFTVPLTKR